MSQGSIIGRGYPIGNENTRQRTSLNRDGLTPSFTPKPLPYDFGPDGNINVNSGFPGSGLMLPDAYKDKRITTLNLDLSSIFTNRLFELAGTVIFFSGESGGVAAPVSIIFDSLTNDPIDLPYDRAISGIPFSRVYITNATTQAGITAKITILKDAPFDRLGLNG